MQKDLKTGMVVGLVLVTMPVLWLATRKGLSTQARMIEAQNNTHQQAKDNQPRFVANLPGTTAISQTPVVSSAGENPIQDNVTDEPPAKIKTVKFHIVRKGETLSAISHYYYGTASKRGKIFEANKNVIDHPDKIRPGMKLIIPD